MTTTTAATTYGATLPLPADFGHFWDFSNTSGSSNHHAAQHDRKIGTSGDLLAALAYPTHILVGNKSHTGRALWLVDGNHPDALTAVVMLHTATGRLTMPTVPFNWTKGFHYSKGRDYTTRDGVHRFNPVLYTATGTDFVPPQKIANTLKAINA